MSIDDGTGGAPGAGALQFDRVEPVATAQGAVRACPRCRRTLGDEYFEAQGRMICRACADDVNGSGGMAWFRALAFGGAAAIAGTLVWFLVVKLFHSELGLVAIGVGLLIGLAVRRGSRGRGGWRYQTLAVALTYVSITTSYVPMVVDGFRQAATEDDAKSAKPNAEGSAPAKPPAANAGAAASSGLGSVVLAFALVFGIAFASPFLAGANNLMGLVIIGIALYEAWKLNRRVPVSGPFRVGAVPVPASASP
jgi:hypothetical protein